MIHSPVVLAVANSGTNTVPPSIRGPCPEIPTYPAPGTLADQRSDLGLLEHCREDVAIRCRVFVDEPHLGPDEDGVGIGACRVVGAGEVQGEQRAPQALDNIWDTLPPPLSRSSMINP
jgi:hypothetical protein